MRDAIKKVDDYDKTGGHCSDMDISEHKQQNQSSSAAYLRKAIGKTKKYRVNGHDGKQHSKLSMRDRVKLMKKHKVNNGNNYEEDKAGRGRACENAFKDHKDYGFSDGEGKNKEYSHTSNNGSSYRGNGDNCKFKFKKKLTSFMPHKKFKYNK